MTNQDNDFKDNFVDSLLYSLYETDKDKARSLVDEGMQRLDDREVASSASARSRRHLARPNWLLIGLATAALVLITVAIPLTSGSRTATAAVMLSLEQALRDVGRHYRMNAVWQNVPEESSRRSGELFVKGGDQFAIKAEVPGTVGTTIWLGSNAETSWVIPPIGPVLEGDERSLTHWYRTRADVGTPYLHVASALEKMRDLYRLESLPKVEVSLTDRVVACNHVAAVLKGEASSHRPDRIELWADAETGVAIKLVATWQLEEDEVGRKEATIVLVDENELSDSFFTVEGQGAGQRRKISFTSEKE
jgi:hypothetical protein